MSYRGITEFTPKNKGETKAFLLLPIYFLNTYNFFAAIHMFFLSGATVGVGGGMRGKHETPIQ